MATKIDSPALRISAELALSLDAITDTIGILAVKGSGKSYTFMVMAEEMVRSGAPVIIIDVVGVCWGLRASADGKGEGLPIVVLGGEHADLPLDPSAGRVLAEFAASERRSLVLDVSAFETKADQIRFVTAFVSRLYEVNREPLHVMIDEADEFAPQKPFGEETRLVRAMEILVRRGRARGIGITMVTQRPAVLNKNVLTMCGTLIIGRVVAPQDRKAIGEWVDAHGTEEQKATLWKSLAALPTSDKWVWTPLAGIFARVRIRARETFDSSATPKLGAVRIEPRKLAPVDLEALRAKMGAAIEKAQADDPKALRARIAELERHVHDARSAAQRENEARERANFALRERVVEKRVEVPVISTADIAEVRQVVEALERLQAEVSAAVQRAVEYVDVIRERALFLRNIAKTSGTTAAGAEPTNETKAPSRSPTPSRSSDSTLGGGERKILTALAQRGKPLERSQIAVMTQYASNGGRFSNLLSALRSAGLIMGDASIEITEKGRAALGPYEKLPEGAAALAYWKAKLGSGEARILDELAAVYPRALTREALGNRTGYEPSGGRFSNLCSYLRTLELIRGTREMKLSEELVG